MKVPAIIHLLFIARPPRLPTRVGGCRHDDERGRLA
jgi:hypothetical protein